MNARERVLKTFAHEAADRVPLDLGGLACEMSDDVYFRVRDCLGITGNIEPYRTGKNTCYYDERVLDALDIDLRRIIVPENRKYPVIDDKGTFTDMWGIKRRKGAFGMEFLGYPLEDAEVEDLEEYPWPKAADVLVLDGLKEKAERLSKNGEYALSLRAIGNGILETACWLRGMENYLMDTIADEEFADALAEKVLDVQMELYGAALDAVGPYVDMVETGDDYGTQTSTLISKESLERYILSKRKRLNALIKEKAPNAKVFFHSCGSIRSIIPSILETGVDILNPVQTTASDMDPKVLKEEFGNRVCFHGGIDTTKAMKGSAEDVEKEVRKMVDSMQGNGGYILASCNNIQGDIPPENVIRLFEYAKDYSRGKC